MRTRAPHVTLPLLSLLELAGSVLAHFIERAATSARAHESAGRGGGGSSKGWAELQGCECDQRAREFRQWDP